MGNLTQLMKEYDVSQAQTRQFRQLSTDSWEDGAISSLQKHLIAVAVAQATTCHQCLIHHAKVAKKQGATVDQLLEVSYLTSVINILGESIQHIDYDLYLAAEVTFTENSVIDQKIHDYINEQLVPDHLDKTTKVLALIAIVRFKENNALLSHLIHFAEHIGITRAQIDETILISVILSAGIIYSHNAELIQLFETVGQA